LRLQQESTRKQQVGTPGGRACTRAPNDVSARTGALVTRARSPIVVRSGDWTLILKDDLGSSRRDAKIAPAGDDVKTPSLLRDAVDLDGQTTVMVTHDPRAAARADRVLFLADGRIVSDLAQPTEADVLAQMKAVSA
jgi:hypothetical protein